jgi:alpha-galactosidase
MKTQTRLLIAMLVLAGAWARAERVEQLGCYASWNDRELVIGNALIERKWKIQDGHLTSVSFRDRVTDCEWLRAPGLQPAPFSGGELADEKRRVSFTSHTGKLNPVEEDSLVVEMLAVGATRTNVCRFQIFPKASGVSVWFNPERPLPMATRFTSDVNEKSVAGVESDKSKAKAKLVRFDAIEDLILSPAHLQFTAVELLDQTDERSELVFEKDWLPVQETIQVPGNIFYTEDILTGRGLIFVKLAPLPPARPVKSEWDARFAAKERRLTFAGQGYPSATLAYSGGRAGRIAALQNFQRQLRAYDPQRDAMFLSNTWGDRSRDARINETFLRAEIDAGARLGVDVIQVDDGWQQGKSANSASVAGGGAWGKFYAADTNFWLPHTERFPDGIKPLVQAAAAKGMKFGLWFAPDSEDCMTNWQRDADRLLDLYRNNGIAYFKIDAVKMESRQAEINLRKFYHRVQTESAGRVVFDADATAGLRPTYFGTYNAGSIFVENRYTDWGNYWPHATLRNLWKLAQYVDPLRLRMEFLNNTRNEEKYEHDPLAPANYAPDTLFATVMFANPLGWFEVSNLPEDYIEKVSKLVAVWKNDRAKIFSGSIIPIGHEPDGVNWTGFISVSADRASARAVIFRERNADDSWTTELPLLAALGQRVTVLAGDGKIIFKNGRLMAKIPNQLGYLFIRIELAEHEH